MMAWLYAVIGTFLYLLDKQIKERELKNKQKAANLEKKEAVKDEIEDEDVDDVRQRARDKWMR